MYTLDNFYQSKQFYIPLWFYSNKYRRGMWNNAYIIFTFHYGSIQIFNPLTYWRRRTLFYIPLWFYSNKMNKAALAFGTILHSTMVLFKYGTNAYAQFAAATFTFHYGSIQIMGEVTSPFTKWFYIPLWFYSNSLLNRDSITPFFFYIPLWFYSNQANPDDTIKLYYFTFHYGSIQIPDRPGLKDTPKILHSTMVLFKFYNQIKVYCNDNFTFHYGSIQISNT